MDLFDQFSSQIDRLDEMSVDQLTAEMEQVMDAMTEETYDSAVIDAYLDAIDRKSAIPAYPDASTAYADFQRRVEAMSGVEVRQAESPYPKPRRKRILRVGLAAVIMVACLFAGVVVAQAAGVDVLGSLAHWTEDVFGFGKLPNENFAPSQDNFSSEKTDVPEEYHEVQAALSERGLPFYFLKAPSGFEVVEESLHTNPVTNFITFSVTYLRGDDCIGFDIMQNDGLSTLIYEKDDGDVEIYEQDGIIHYIFTNNGSTTAAWLADNVEYCISTNSSFLDMKELIRAVY